MVAPAGIEPWPQTTSVLPRFTLFRISGTSPPGPQRCGSTTCRVKAVATAASNALPPRSRMPMPTAVAIQCVEVTTPNVPVISGRVVNGLGLISFKACLRGVQFPEGDLKPPSACPPAGPQRQSLPQPPSSPPPVPPPPVSLPAPPVLFCVGGGELWAGGVPPET